jgi:acetolactate synthase I/III small subunit
MQHTIVALVQNKPGVLSRAINLFRRRGLNIDTLTVNRTADPTVSRLTLVAECENVTQLIAQLQKLLDVVEAHELRPYGAPASRIYRPATPPSSPLAVSQADGIA